MAEYVESTPSPVYAITFAGEGQLSSSDLKGCVPGLSDQCQTFSTPPKPPTTVHPPTVFQSQTVAMANGAQHSYSDCLWSCLTGDTATVATGAAGGGAVASGSIPKKLIGVRQVGSKFTSVPSIIAHKFPHLDGPLPKWITNKAPVFRFVPPGVSMRSTTSTLRFIGRWIPGVGWGLLAVDLIVLDQCVAGCRNDKSFLRKVWDETLGVKPAY